VKNIILISIDSLRADALGCCGNKTISTPNIDQLARKGHLFKNTIVQAPYTVGSHASMLTGLYPFNHGLRGQYTRCKLAKNSLHLLKKVKEDHKLLSFARADLFGASYGYDIWDFQMQPKVLSIRNSLRRNRQAAFFAFIHYWGVHSPYATDLAENRWEQLGEQLEKLIKNNYMYVPQPGLGWLHKILFGADSRKREKIRRAMRNHEETLIERVKAGYSMAVQRADVFVAQILEILDSLGILNDTIIILTADHGESFNEFNETEQFPNEYEHGHLLYDTVIRVPLIVTDFTSNSCGKKTIEKQVQTIDVMPTIIDILGKGQYLSPTNVNGRSLLRHVKEKAEGSDDKFCYAYTETMQDSEAADRSGLDKACIRSDDGYKLIFDYRKGSETLVSYRRGEKEDIKGEEPDIFHRLRAEFRKLIEDSEIDLYKNQGTMSEKEYHAIAKRLKELGYVE
jgi:arylsulfatase A-like enzyme